MLTLKSMVMFFLCLQTRRLNTTNCWVICFIYELFYVSIYSLSLSVSLSFCSLHLSLLLFLSLSLSLSLSLFLSLPRRRVRRKDLCMCSGAVFCGFDTEEEEGLFKADAVNEEDPGGGGGKWRRTRKEEAALFKANAGRGSSRS